MKKYNENFFSEHNLVFLAGGTTPGAGSGPSQAPQQGPQQTPPQAPSHAPQAQLAQLQAQTTPAQLDQLREDIDPKKAMGEFSNEFNNRAYELLVTLDDKGEKYNFDKWVGNTAWGDNPKTNEICAEIQKICGSQRQCRSSLGRGKG